MSYLYEKLDPATLNDEQKIWLVKNLGMYTPPQITQDEYSLHDQFFALMIDALFYGVYTQEEILQEFNKFLNSDLDQKNRILIVQDKKISQKIDNIDFYNSFYSEEITMDLLNSILKQLPKEKRPEFLFILENEVNPPINFNEENYPEYFNVLPDDEMPTQESQVRLQQIMAQQAKLNSANPGYNRVISPMGFSQMVQRPMDPISAEKQMMQRAYVKPKVYNQNGNFENNSGNNLEIPQKSFQQNISANSIQNQQNYPTNQPQFHVPAQGYLNNTQQNPQQNFQPNQNINQASQSRNKSLDYLLQKP